MQPEDIREQLAGHIPFIIAHNMTAYWNDMMYGKNNRRTKGHIWQRNMPQFGNVIERLLSVITVLSLSQQPFNLTF